MNFVYFNPDEMRADALGCYGHPAAQTPNIDAFAREAVRYDQCHVQHTVCTPSRCSFMTGWYPHVRGHRTLWHALQPDEPNTLKYLKNNGYDVHVIGKNDLLSQAEIPTSISELHHAEGGDQFGRGVPVHSEGEPGFFDFLYAPRKEHPNDYHKVMEAVRFIENYTPGSAPFMLYLPIVYPHCPYTAPEPWYSMYDPDDLPPLRSSEGAGKPDYHQVIREYRGLSDLPEGELKKIMAVYLGMVSYVDYLFGLVIDALKANGLYDDTAVFFFSDHGDWAGDYGLVEKWPSGLDDCLTRIPMVVKTPGCTGGHEVLSPVECFDIVPTTLELAGIEADHTHFGVSMRDTQTGGEGDPERAVFAEGGYAVHEPHCFEGKPSDGVAGNPKSIYYPKGMQQQERPETVSRASMIRTLSHKLVRRPGGVHELYDLQTDPLEESNVYGTPEYAGVQIDLEARLLDWYVQTSDVTPHTPDPRGWQPQ